MKLYTEEQVRQMLSIYMANVLLDVDGKMPTVDEILSYRTPIELPSDDDIESGMNQRLFLSDKNAHFNSGAKAGFKLGAKWMKEQILNQNK
jgi:hypothetical protein